jgi:hypothetical protein
MNSLITPAQAQEELEACISSLSNVSSVSVKPLTNYSEQMEVSNWILEVSATIKTYKLLKWWVGQPISIGFTVQGTYQIDHGGIAELNVSPELENAELTYVMWKVLDCETMFFASTFGEFKQKLQQLLCP